MNLPDVPLFDLLRQRMEWLNARQNVLSQNVANADVQGYVAQDLKPQDFSDLLKNVTGASSFAMAVTDPAHISAASSISGTEAEIETVDKGSLNKDSAVSQEQEMIEVANTQAQYQAATNLYSKSVQMMRTAIDRSGS